MQPLQMKMGNPSHFSILQQTPSGNLYNQLSQFGHMQVRKKQGEKGSGRVEQFSPTSYSIASSSDTELRALSDEPQME